MPLSCPLPYRGEEPVISEGKEKVILRGEKYDEEII